MILYGYIYIRNHESYEIYKLIKIGKTNDLISRGCTYATGEIKRGSYIQIYKLPIDILNQVDNHIKTEFKHYNNYYNAGTEFYNIKIINEIETFFINYNYNYQKISIDQIKHIECLIDNTIHKNIKSLHNTFKPYKYQQDVLDKINNFYSINNIGKICWACGLGKALLSILIVTELKCNLVVIGVPSIHLQRQMKQEILKLFPNKENIKYIGSESKNSTVYPLNIKSNSDHEINNFINNKSYECKFIITTYTSCYLLSDNYYFDLKIGDEAHHLAGTHNERTKLSFHNIKSDKTLFMTATEKLITGQNCITTYSMDDENVFGKLIDSKSIHWAIENKKITDYNLIILKNTENEINNIISNLNLYEDTNSILDHKDLFLSAFMALKSIEKYNNLTHILIYTNATENAILIQQYIDIIMNLDIINLNYSNYYNKALYNGNSKSFNDKLLSNGDIIKGELTKFIESDFGIISSVYIFGEGFDCPRLNGVIFSDNMNSDVRIVQSALRPNRKDNNYPDKIAYVIIPYIETNYESDSYKYNSFDKCKNIISKIRNVDETVQQKIQVISFSSSSDNKNTEYQETIQYPYIIENSLELEKIKLKLIYSKILNSQLSDDQNEFNYMQKLNKELQIQNKEDYINYKVKYYYINNNIEYQDEPELYFKKKCIWTNWFDFLGIDINKFIKTKEEWIIFCKPHNIKNVQDYINLCKIHNELPLNPAELYLDFTDIIKELYIYKRRR